VQIIGDAWEEVPEEVLRNGFRAAGIGIDEGEDVGEGVDFGWIEEEPGDEDAGVEFMELLVQEEL
jgi:hypothetical protein